METTPRDARIAYIVDLYQKIYPEKEVDPNTIIKGTAIAKLCEYDSAPYKRIKGWCESKLGIGEITYKITHKQLKKLWSKRLKETGKNHSFKENNEGYLQAIKDMVFIATK